MPPANVPSTGSIPPTPAARVGTGRLALLFQESLTAIVRLRGGRHPVTDAADFRARMTQLLGRADEEARASGYAPDDVRLAVFAVVALLDESVLNAGQPSLADWARRPLQDELFGGHMAGEWFFQHVEQLLARPDTPALANLLEVHGLCLLLGFRGRYGADDRGALHAYGSRVAERVARIRGTAGAVGVPDGDLVPGWRPADDAVVAPDPWVRRLAVGLAAAVVVAAAVWGAGALSLRAAAADLAALAPAAAPAVDAAR